MRLIGWTSDAHFEDFDGKPNSDIGDLGWTRNRGPIEISVTMELTHPGMVWVNRLRAQASSLSEDEIRMLETIDTDAH
jgi:hypothetical protein